MNKVVKDLLVGILLGDGSIRRVSSNKASISFGQSGQKSDYFNYVYESIKAENILLNEPVFRTFTDPRYPTKINSSWNFSSKSSEELRELAELFLDANGKKIVPSNISELLTPRSLAFWIMDDGQHVNRGGVTLCTDNFKHEEILKLQEGLKSNFDLKTTLHFKKGILNSYERIYISKNSAYEILKPSIAEHMDNSMLYKINMGPKPSINPKVQIDFIAESNAITEIESPANTNVGNLTAAAIADESLDQIIGESIDDISTLEIVNEILTEIYKL